MSGKKPKIVKIPKYQAGGDLIRLINDVKKSAEKGEINSLFVVAGRLDGGICDGFAVDSGGRPFSLLGGIEAAKKRFCEKEIE